MEATETSARLQSSLDSANAENRALSESKARVEAELRELRAAHDASRAANESARGTAAELREQCGSLDAIKFEQEKELHRLGLSLAAAEQQVRDKEEVIGKMTALLESAGAHKDNVEDSLALYKENHSKLHAKLEASVSEINKGNRIITQLQADLRDAKGKLRSKSAVLRQQEALLEERSEAARGIERRLLEAEGGLASRDVLLRGMEEKAAAAAAAIAEKDELLSSNQQVIAWLNKEINQAQLGFKDGMRGATVSPSVTPVSNAYAFRPSFAASAPLEKGGGVFAQ